MHHRLWWWCMAIICLCHAESESSLYAAARRRPLRSILQDLQRGVAGEGGGWDLKGTAGVGRLKGGVAKWSGLICLMSSYLVPITVVFPSHMPGPRRK